jgi:DNA-binding NarL/FixJ family response regulator
MSTGGGQWNPMSSVTTASRPGDGQVITLHGEGELMARAGHLFDAQEELICAAVDMTTWTSTNRRLDRGLAAMAEHVAAGLQVRKMYNPAALANPADADHLRAIASAGARVRISPTAVAHETIMIDRRIAILAGAPVAGVRDFTVIMAPKAVEAVRSLFLATWAGAIDLDDFAPTTPVVDEQGREILRLLSGGHKDEAAARCLGISVRTYRRRVADLMALLGAESRFQAGARAKALGLRW